MPIVATRGSPQGEDIQSLGHSLARLCNLKAQDQSKIGSYELHNPETQGQIVRNWRRSFWTSALPRGRKSLSDAITRHGDNFRLSSHMRDVTGKMAGKRFEILSECVQGT